ncbi:MAG: uroporphyrinogen-III C-methyltransferase [Nitrospiraceae bacterium]
MPRGKVYLVGAGPGDPGLLTLKGKECLERADMILTDYLVNPLLLTYTRSDAEHIRLGRRGTAEYLDQEAIIAVLIRHAKLGKHVVRLKNGDPFLFGRGGEEAAALAEQDIDFEVVPGISSAIGCPAYLGIPVTHRRYASQVTIVTGHEDPTQPAPDIDWKSFAASGGTLVILMGLRTLPTIFDWLLKYGKPVRTPVAIISQGTLPTQRVLVGTLEEIGGRFVREEWESPVMAVIGEVVRLQQQLQWFVQTESSSQSTLSARSDFGRESFS